MNRFSRLVAATVVATLSTLLPSASAQSLAPSPDGPYWNTVPLPQNLILGPSAVGTLVVMQSTTEVHLYSGITREWSVIPAASTATISNFNAYAIIEDGNQIHGYATRRGVVDTINVSAGAIVTHGPSYASWVSIVQDGPLIWGFSAFLGKWEPLVVLGSAPTVIANQMVAVVHDGSSAYGFSAYTGTWSKTAADVTATVDASGVVAVASSPGIARAYSAQTGEWSVQNFGNTSGFALDRGFVIFTDGPSVLAFSGYTGSFSSYTAPSAGFTLNTSRNVASIVDGNTVTGYAAGVGLFDTVTIPAPILDMNREVFLATGGGSVYAFSGVTGTFAAPLAGTFTAWTNEAVAYASGTPNSYAYSPMLNAWTMAPTVTLVAPEHLSRSSAILPTTTGYEAFATRYGTWVSLTTSQIGNYSGKSNAAIFAAIDGAQSEIINIWDSRENKWTSLTAANTPVLNMFRTVAIAQDFTKGYGFGLMNNVWEEVTLQGNPVLTKASSSIGIIETDTHLHTFTAHGSLSTYSRWPEFSRFQPKGVALTTILSAPAGSTVAYLLANGPGGGEIPPFGNFFLDFNSLWFLNILPTVPADGLLKMPLSLPNDPALTGFSPHIQCFVVPPLAAPYLTNSMSPVLF